MPFAAAQKKVLGSIAAHGSVQVGDVLSPDRGTLFAGDRIKTNNGGALVQYRTATNVTIYDGKASIAVTEGALMVVGPLGVQLGLLNAGDARLFEEVPAVSGQISDIQRPVAPAKDYRGYCFGISLGRVCIGVGKR